MTALKTLEFSQESSLYPRLAFQRSAQDSTRRAIGLEQRSSNAPQASLLTPEGLLNSSIEITNKMLLTGVFPSTSRFASAVIDNKDKWRLENFERKNIEGSLNPDGSMFLNRANFQGLIDNLKANFTANEITTIVASQRFGVILHESVHAWVDKELDKIAGVNSYWPFIENEFIANGYHARGLSEAAGRTFNVVMRSPAGDTIQKFNFTTARLNGSKSGSIDRFIDENELMKAFHEGRANFERLIRDRYKQHNNFSIFDTAENIAREADKNAKIDSKNAASWKNLATIARDPRKLEELRQWFRTELSNLYNLQTPKPGGYNQKFEK